MRIEEMHWAFELVYNKIFSNQKRSFFANEKDAFLQRGINEYVEMFYKGRNSKGFNIGFEVDQQRIDMLSTLVVSELEQPEITPVNSANGVYEFALSDLVHEYKHFLRGKVNVKDCDHFYNLAIEQTDDLNYVLRDENRKPSNTWKRVVGQVRKSSSSLGESSLYLYTNEDFEIEGLKLEYLKKPEEVCLGNYTDIPTLDNPTPALKPQVHCDLPEQYHDLIVDIAVQEASRVLEDVNRLQAREHRINRITN